MAIAGTIKEGATSVAATGGTDVTLSSLGIQNGKNPYIFSTDTAQLTARVAEFGAKLSAPNASSLGGYTQSRRDFAFKIPKVKADGTRAINTVRVSVGFDIETTDAEVETAMEQAAQMVGTANFLPFWKTGNLT